MSTNLTDAFVRELVDATLRQIEQLGDGFNGIGGIGCHRSWFLSLTAELSVRGSAALQLC